MTEFLLLLAGFVGGVLNTLAGGGSFIVFPALLAAGLPPVVANATNTFAAFPGYVSGALGFRHDIWRHRRRLPAYTAVALVFGFAGAELLLHVSNATFSKIVPWLMGFAALLFAFGAQINRFVTQRAGRSRSRQRLGAGLLLALLAAVSLYGGFFNAGLGILLLAFLAVAGLTDIHAMNGLKLYVAAIIAAISVARFGLTSAIDWYHGTLALFGVVSGAYVSARLAHRVPTRWIRAAVIVYSFGLSAWFFYTSYFASPGP